MQKKQVRPTKKQLQKIYGINYRKYLNRMKMRKLQQTFDVIFIIIENKA
ncbi:MAG: hypothetical protein Q8M44_03290 [bacterium]|nr:hypothetical protein [bacterium]